MSSSNLRIVDFEGYRNVIRHYEEARDDEVAFIIGDVAEPREWDDLAEDAEVTGEEPWSYFQETTILVEDGVKHYADYAYPAWTFADEETTEDLEAADSQLAGLHAFPMDALVETHHRVLTVEDLCTHVHALEQEYGDDYVCLTGNLQPRSGDLRIGQAGSMGQIASTYFPGTAFDDSVFAGLQSSNGILAGTQILPREVVADEALRVVDGEVQEAGPENEAETEAETA